VGALPLPLWTPAGGGQVIVIAGLEGIDEISASCSCRVSAKSRLGGESAGLRHAGVSW
jgi:hypothetical protein